MQNKSISSSTDDRRVDTNQPNLVLKESDLDCAEYSQTYNTIHENSDVIYDDVCPSQPTFNSNCTRRWSAPLFNQYSSPSSIGMNLVNKTQSWFIPPPSQRLLAEPLPTLPSLGPSACESRSGTISSSYASSNFTTDELNELNDDLPVSFIGVSIV